MTRPVKHRNIKCSPTAYYFKPRAVPMSDLEEVLLEIDELESLRLADYLALSHEQAASQMKISRATFGRIIEKARKKIVDAILNGKAIKIGEEIPKQLKAKAVGKCSKCKTDLNNKVTENKSRCKRCKQNIKKGEVK